MSFIMFYHICILLHCRMFVLKRFIFCLLYPSQSPLPLKPRPPAKQCLFWRISKSEGSRLKGRRDNKVMFFFPFDNWAAANRDDLNDLIGVLISDLK